jgi:hypothetical protein
MILKDVDGDAVTSCFGLNEENLMGKRVFRRRKSQQHTNNKNGVNKNNYSNGDVKKIGSGTTVP